MVSFRALSAADATVSTDDSDEGDVRLLRGIEIASWWQILPTSNLAAIQSHLRIVPRMVRSFEFGTNSSWLLNFWKKLGRTWLRQTQTDPDSPNYSGTPGEHPFLWQRACRFFSIRHCSPAAWLFWCQNTLDTACYYHNSIFIYITIVFWSWCSDFRSSVDIASSYRRRRYPLRPFYS